MDVEAASVLLLAIPQDNNANAYAIDLVTGREIWVYKCLFPIAANPSNALVRHGRVFFGCSDGNWHAGEWD